MPSSYPGQHTLSRAAHRKRESLQHKNTRSCPLCSCTPEDTCHTPRTHSHLFPQAEERRKKRKTWIECRKIRPCQCLNRLNTQLTNWCVVYLRRCVFLSLWACSRACTNRGCLPASGRYSCVHRCCHCTCVHCHGLTGANTKTYWKSN